MSTNYGTGVSRTLTPEQRQFLAAVFQKGKPPLDAELNLGQQLQFEALSQYIRTIMPSGWFLDPTKSRGDFLTDKSWSNFFMLGNPAAGESSPVMWAVVNGWVVPVAGTKLSTEGDVRNKVRLYPAPSSDTRIDLVFLEVWQTLIQPNPSTTNKPSATKVWKYGNVEYGQSNVDDDLLDLTIGRETTRRVQLQYRIRVFGQGAGLGASAALDVYPDGMDDPNVLGQGTATSPVSGYAFTNMREELGDPSLWRAGDGNANNSLGTVDGYTYAVPICAVFRRNNQTFTAVNLSGNPNNNGSFDRNPSAPFLTNPREGAKILSTATLTSVLAADTTGVVQIDNLVDSGIDDPKHTLANVFLVIDDEIIEITSVDSISSPGTVTIPTGGRGRGGTHATRHDAGAVVSIYSARPDGLFADEISSDDILDLRRAVNPGDWDYQRLLLHNLANLAQNRMQSAWKKSATGDTQGPSVLEISLLHANGSITALNHTEPVDGPDGIRTVFSDAATLQTDVTLLLDNDAALTGGFTTDQFDSTATWDVGAAFKPTGFINNLGATGNWTNGSVIFFHIGGDSGTEGARATFRDGSTRAVRFVSPREYWKTQFPDDSTGKQHPWSLRFLDQYAHHPLAPGELVADVDAGTKHPGPYYPLQEQNFERPFIVLGGLLKTAYKFTNIDSNPAPAQPGLVNGPNGPELRVGVDFDLTTTWETQDLLNGRFTLADLYYGSSEFQSTRRDTFGNLSQIYVVLYGDTANANNNGCFRVIGAGTAFTENVPASDSVSLRLEPLDPSFTTFTIAAGQTLTAELRSFHMTVDDGGGFAAGSPAACVVLTDIQGSAGGTANPWNEDNLGFGSGNDYSIPLAVPSKLQVNCSLLYNPGRGATARVADEVWRASLLDAGATYLRQATGSLDSTFVSAVGLPSAETFFEPAQLQVWNRLPSLGLTENSTPKAPSFGGRVVAFSEQDREAELFLDKGSKTMLFRPFQDKSMTLKAITTNASDGLLGDTLYPDTTPKDGAGLFTSGHKMGFPVPSEYMPRFGRQDVPYHVDLTGTGSGSFLEGINHLFTDSGDPTEPQFSIIGGQDNTSGGNLVKPIYFQTGTTSGHNYAVYGTIAGPGIAAYQARLTTAIGTLTSEAQSLTERLAAVQSSDLGAGLEGIQLPPYLGIARLYGVYDRDDFIAKGGQTFGSDRITPVASPPTNLLREDADRQTLFIFQDGARDITLETGDHTYIIPSNAIDITLSPSYAPGTKDSFSDFEYVVECAVFGFAKDWINGNNYVLARLHTGSGALVSDGSDPELEQVRMTIPSPAVLNDRMYLGYSRTPYQGDPFMSREGSSRTVTDYEHRYGQVSIANAYLLNAPIEQFDSNGDIQVETPNARALEVLAAVDFYTTLGTGKIGGELYPGTLMDVGYTEDTPEASSRLPATSTQHQWSVLTRAYTEGQRKNQTHASIRVDFIATPGTLTGVQIEVTRFGQTTTTFTGVAGPPATAEEFDVGADNTETAQNFVNAVTLHPNFAGVLGGYTSGTRVATLFSLIAGNAGNQHQIEVLYAGGGGQTYDDIRILVNDNPGDVASQAQIGFVNFSGASDQIVNAGDGTSQLKLTGFTERLPLGILLQDSDFLAENPLNDHASSLVTKPSAIRPVQSILPLTTGGNEFDRFLGDPGELVSLSDGAILRYEAYNASSSPAGTKRFRLFRGGGSVFVLSGDHPGGPADWVSDSFPASSLPVLKGGVLTCKALLVRNYGEEAFATSNTTSQGDEIQMVLLTYGILGDGTAQQNGIQLDGVIGATGYGEGYAAADRYRIEGKPMFHGFSRTTPDPDGVVLAVFPGRS